MPQNRWGTRGAPRFGAVAKNRSPRPPRRSRRRSRDLADPLRRHPFRQHRNAITRCRSHVRSVRCANNAIRALDCLLTIKSQAHHRTTKTRTTQAHDPFAADALARHDKIGSRSRSTAQRNPTDRFKSRTRKRVCYNFWPGRPPAAGGKVKNGHQFAA